MKRLVLFIMLFSCFAHSQNTVSGKVIELLTGSPLQDVEIYDKASGLLTRTNEAGRFQFVTEKEQLIIIFFAYGFKIDEQQISVTTNTVVNATLETLSEELSEIQITTQKERVFELRQLKDVEETAIYAGKKTEVVLMEQTAANIATNNARQIYSQVSGLNIYQNDDAGLQLNIGGRGLDPTRTSNFNTRQNGYDISADVLGYPESYYTPPAEVLDEIQVVRGAASLQYGTQFGGLINFKFKSSNPNKPFEFLTRNTLGSNGLYTNFTSLNGTSNKLNYFGYFNYKKGDGFRPNSDFESKNAFLNMGYQLSDKTKVSGEITYLRYLAHQAGGLTDNMFDADPYQSNRTRNWFQVDWLLYNLKLAHQFSDNTNFTFNFFGLNAQREAIGFRTRRQDQPDSFGVRDLIIGEFNNFGFESRLLIKYKLLGKSSIGLVGVKFYNADNNSIQGPGSDGSGPDFNLSTDEFPNYPNQSNYKNPNLNISIFGENILYLNDKWSLTPGIRFEYIKTESDGFFKRINLDGADNVILNETIFTDDINERSFVLFGLGSSFKPNNAVEFYGNISQNYRSVTFSDINITNPAFVIDPDISDEKGFTSDLGIRGRIDKKITYDVNVFGLFYNDRIGVVLKTQEDNSVKNERSNIGDALIYGIESLIDFNLNELILKDDQFRFAYYINLALINSEYVESEIAGIEGNEVEFVPKINLKTGLRFGYKDFQANAQYTYLSKQFSDASNAESDPSGNSGIIGPIDAYNVLDVSFSYKYKIFKLETGVNNLLDKAYFTRRATGYPGPGIITSPPRNWYVTLQIKL